jgi:hypothetical protein
MDIITRDANEEAIRVLSVAWGRSDFERLEHIRSDVRRFLRDRPQLYSRVAWIRRLNYKVYSVEDGATFQEWIWGPICPGVFLVDDNNINEYRLGAAMVQGVFDSTYIVLLDTTHSLDSICALVLGAMNACGQGSTVYISLDVCDLTTQTNAARVFPVSRLCTYEEVYPAVLRRLKLRPTPGFHPTTRWDCELQKYLAPDFWIRFATGSQWFESELGTLAIVFDRRRDEDRIAVVFKLWCEEAHHVLRLFLKSRAQENLLLFLQSDGDTGPDRVRKADIMYRMSSVKKHRPLRDSGLYAAFVTKLREDLPVMAFEGSETIVHKLDATTADRMFPHVYAKMPRHNVHKNVFYIALSADYSLLLGYAICKRKKTKTLVIACERLVDELWYAIFQFEKLPIEIDAGAGTRVLKAPDEHDVARAVLRFSTKGTAFMRRYVGDKSRPHASRPCTASIGTFTAPHIFNAGDARDQSVLLQTDMNCWKRLAGYVGMTPSRIALHVSLCSPNSKLTFTEQNYKNTLIFSDLGYAFYYKDGGDGEITHCYTVDDPNYMYTTPPFNYDTNDAWFIGMAAIFPQIKDVFERIETRRRAIKRDSTFARTSPVTAA